MNNRKDKLTCYTIGHSSHDIGEFTHLLKKHNINCVVDIRSTPYSQYNPQFNRENLKRYLENVHISYIFMGNSLGGRYDDQALFFGDKPVVDFRKVMERDEYKKGIQAIIDGIEKGDILVLMCAEKDPFNCHRFALVGYGLQKEGVNVKHILEDGKIIDNEELEKELLSKYRIESTLFEQITEEEAIEMGYVKRNRDIGYESQELLGRS